METGSGKAWKRELGNATNSKQPPRRSRPSKLKGSDSKQRERNGDDGSDGDIDITLLCCCCDDTHVNWCGRCGVDWDRGLWAVGFELWAVGRGS